MRMQEALKEIAGLADKPMGYEVVFERPTDGKAEVVRGQFISTQDSFPDIRAGEPPIRDEAEAWALARAFAAKTVGWTRRVHVRPVPYNYRQAQPPVDYLNPEWKPAPKAPFES